MNISMGNPFYRFRPTSALLNGHQELQHQEIYFAAPNEFNDPLEGFKDLVWKGDDILWRNLLRHYILCLTCAVKVALIKGPDHIFAESDSFTFANESTLPTTEFGELHRSACEQFFQHADVAVLPGLLAGRTSPIRRNELVTYIRALHLHALNAVLNAMEEYAGLPVRAADDPLRTASTKPINCKVMLDVLNQLEREHPDKPDIVEATSAVTEVAAIQQNLILEYNGTSLKSGAAWQTLISEFPRRHIRELEQLLYSDWYTACFVEDPTDASMWGTYGNGHEGVCLKFRAQPDPNGAPVIKLKRICGYSGDKHGSLPICNYVAHDFRKVEYSSKFVEIDFFRSLGRLTMPMLQHWYQDAAGKPSPLVMDILSESDNWRKHHWEQFRTAITTKLLDWAHEKEFRLTISGWTADLKDRSSRKLKYHFSDL